MEGPWESCWPATPWSEDTGPPSHTYNLRIFDPTWFDLPSDELMRRLQKRIEVKEGKKLRLASEAYLRFLSLGGELRMEDLSPAL